MFIQKTDATSRPGRWLRLTAITTICSLFATACGSGGPDDDGGDITYLDTADEQSESAAAEQIDARFPIAGNDSPALAGAVEWTGHDMGEGAMRLVARDEDGRARAEFVSHATVGATPEETTFQIVSLYPESATATIVNGEIVENSFAETPSGSAALAALVSDIERASDGVPGPDGTVPYLSTLCKLKLAALIASCGASVIACLSGAGCIFGAALCGLRVAIYKRQCD